MHDTSWRQRIVRHRHKYKLSPSESRTEYRPTHCTHWFVRGSSAAAWYVVLCMLTMQQATSTERRCIHFDTRELWWFTCI